MRRMVVEIAELILFMPGVSSLPLPFILVIAAAIAFRTWPRAATAAPLLAPLMAAAAVLICAASDVPSGPSPSIREPSLSIAFPKQLYNGPPLNLAPHWFASRMAAAPADAMFALAPADVGHSPTANTLSITKPATANTTPRASCPLRIFMRTPHLVQGIDSLARWLAVSGHVPFCHQKKC